MSIHVSKMITWKKEKYGFRFTLSSPLNLEEANKWKEDVRQALTQLDGEYSVFADLRKCVLIPAECKPIIEDVQLMCKSSRLKRSVVIVSDPITVGQMKYVAKSTGIYEWERYIDASSNSNWERFGLDWIIDGIDPDNVTVPLVTSLFKDNQ